MKRRELEREGKEWVKEGIITEEQLQQILSRKQATGPNFIIVLFAVLLTGLSFLTFIMSEWAREPHLSRVLLLLLFIFFFYVLGDVLYRRKNELYGVSFIVLGYIVFGSGLLLVIDIYQVMLFSAWPFVIWTVVGLVLFFIYKHSLIFAVTVLIGTIGQIYSGLGYSDFNWYLFVALFLLGGFFAYREKNSLFYALLAVSYSFQAIVLTNTVFDYFYWYLVPVLVLYLVGDVLKKQRTSFGVSYIALGSIFIFGMYQTLMLQEDWYMRDIPSLDWSFVTVWLVLFALGLFSKWRQEYRIEMIDFILFLPIVFLPLNHIWSILVLFIFALGWIFIGYRNNSQQQIMLGTVAFLFSTLNVYVQYAWDALNKSLFFFTGGVILFAISFVIERQRRKLLSKTEGSNKR